MPTDDSATLLRYSTAIAESPLTPTASRLAAGALLVLAVSTTAEFLLDVRSNGGSWVRAISFGAALGVAWSIVSQRSLQLDHKKSFFRGLIGAAIAIAVMTLDTAHLGTKFGWPGVAPLPADPLSATEAIKLFTALLIGYVIFQLKRIESVEQALLPAYEFLCRQWKPLTAAWIAIMGTGFILTGSILSATLILTWYLVAPNREIEQLPF